MTRHFISAAFLPVFVMVIGGCASTPVYWKKEAWAKQSSEDAHAYCSKQAKVATEIDAITADHKSAPQWNDYMKECMANHGFTLVRGHEPEQEKKIDTSRGTASATPAPNS